MTTPIPGGFPTTAEQDEVVFRQAVKDLREKKGWTQNQLATELQKAGLEEYRQTTVARLENGTRAIRLGESGIIAKTLGVTTEEMLLPPEVLHRVVQLHEITNHHWETTFGLIKALKQFLLTSSVACRYRRSKDEFMEYRNEVTSNFPYEETINNRFDWLENQSNFDISLIYEMALRDAVRDPSFYQDYLPELATKLENTDLTKIAGHITELIQKDNDHAQGD